MTTDNISKTFTDPDGEEFTISTNEQEVWDEYIVTQHALLQILHTRTQPLDIKDVASALEMVSDAALAFKTTMGTTV